MPEIDPHLFAKHAPAGTVTAAEANDWAWDQAPLPSPQLLVLLAVARHVHVTNLDAFPHLLGLTSAEVSDAVLDLIVERYLCASLGGGVHIALDCHC